MADLTSKSLLKHLQHNPNKNLTGRNTMKPIFKWSLLTALFIQFLSVPAFANSNPWIVQNQEKARIFITQLRNGADPDRLKRPHLRRHNKWKVKQSRKEIKRAMDRAEALARAGKQHLITIPDYVFAGSSEK
jgi:hypothetical protein